MPSTIGYANIDQILNRQTKEYQLVQDIANNLMSYASDKQISSADIARRIFDNSGHLMSKHNADLLTYYQCVLKAIKSTNISINNQEVITTLIKLIETSTMPLRDFLKKGGYIK